MRRARERSRQPVGRVGGIGAGGLFGGGGHAVRINVAGGVEHQKERLERLAAVAGRIERDDAEEVVAVERVREENRRGDRGNHGGRSGAGEPVGEVGGGEVIGCGPGDGQIAVGNGVGADGAERRKGERTGQEDRRSVVDREPG